MSTDFSRAILAVGPCLSVSLSIISRYCIETVAWIKVMYEIQASFDLFYTVF